MIDDVIKVVLVDDHAVVRAGLKAVLGTAKDIEVIGEGSTARMRSHSRRGSIPT